MDFKIVAVTIFQFLPVLVISTVGLEAIAAFFKKYPNPKKYLDTVFKNKSLCPFYCPGLFSLFLIYFLQCFLHTVDAIPKVEILELQFDAKM